MSNKSKDSAHLYHQEYFDKLASLEDGLQSAVLAAPPSPPHAEGLRRQAPPDFSAAEIYARANQDWISKLAQLLDRRARIERERPRFVRFAEREAISVPADAWNIVMTGSWGAGMHYKGLLNVKSPIDLALYAMLIWELKPATILELGSFQGGSALWFADQLQAQLGGGSVHSFDINPDSVSERARHPAVTFHRADLRQPESLGADLLGALPHPWLVIDDAHVNVLPVLAWLGPHLRSGDYYIIEDVVAMLPAGELAALLDAQGFLVDTFYCDNYGYNLTISPNGWLRKT